MKSLCSTVSKDCSDELKFLSSNQAGDATSSVIEAAVSSPWQKIKYTEAVNTLLQVRIVFMLHLQLQRSSTLLCNMYGNKFVHCHQVTDKTFESKLELGMPLSREHLRY